MSLYPNSLSNLHTTDKSQYAYTYANMETEAYLPGRLWIGSRARAFYIIINKYIISSYSTQHMVISSAYMSNTHAIPMWPS